MAEHTHTHTHSYALPGLPHGFLPVRVSSLPPESSPHTEPTCFAMHCFYTGTKCQLTKSICVVSFLRLRRSKREKKKRGRSRSAVQKQRQARAKGGRGAWQREGGASCLTENCFVFPWAAQGTPLLGNNKLDIIGTMSLEKKGISPDYSWKNHNMFLNLINYKCRICCFNCSSYKNIQKKK